VTVIVTLALGEAVGSCAQYIEPVHGKSSSHLSVLALV
jgi:hypothetical protein